MDGAAQSNVRSPRWDVAAAHVGIVAMGAFIVGTIPALFTAPTFTWRLLFGILAVPFLAIALARTLPITERLVWAPLALLTLAIAAAVTSPFGPSETLIGPYGEGGGLLVVVLSVGFFCLPFALAVEDRMRPAWERVLGIVLAVHAVVAVWQAVWTDAYEAFLDAEFDRVRGLAGNPVFLGSLMAGGCAFFATKLLRDRWGSAGFVACAAGLTLSGSRPGLVAAIVGSALAAWTPRDLAKSETRDDDNNLDGHGTISEHKAVAARHPLARVAIVQLILIGIVVVVSMLNSFRGQGAVVQRLAGESTLEAGSARSRLENGLIAFRTLKDRPILGSGPGTFRLATMPNRTLALARSEGADEYYGDAHSLPLEWAVTLGVPAGVLSLIWIGSALLAGRRLGDGIFAASVALVLAQMTQPLRLGVTVPTFLLLGLAAARRRGPPANDRGPLLAVAALPTLVLVTQAARALPADALLYPAIHGGNREAARQALDLAPFMLHTSIVAINVELAYARSKDGMNLFPDAVPKAYLYVGVAQDRFPEEPVSYQAEALIAQQESNWPRALDAWNSLLERNRFSVRARVGRARNFIRLGRFEDARRELAAARKIRVDAELRKATAELKAAEETGVAPDSVP